MVDSSTESNAPARTGTTSGTAQVPERAKARQGCRPFGFSFLGTPHSIVSTGPLLSVPEWGYRGAEVSKMTSGRWVFFPRDSLCPGGRRPHRPSQGRFGRGWVVTRDCGLIGRNRALVCRWKYLCYHGSAEARDTPRREKDTKDCAEPHPFRYSSSLYAVSEAKGWHATMKRRACCLVAGVSHGERDGSGSRHTAGGRKGFQR